MTGKITYRGIDRLAESISHAKGECVFLIGAGFSFSAGIPLAGSLVEEIKETFPFAYADAEIKVYNHVMAELLPQQRSELLTGYINKAKVNWAHLALAQLFHTNKINRILTVNFDPLILKACSMVGEFPAVYDLATASEFKESRISPKSVFYLNGQHTGFAMLNAEGELSKHKERLRDIVKNTGSGRIWVVIGYSGDADPLAEVLQEFAQSSGFDNGLYWIGHSEKPSNTQAKFLSSDNTFFIGKQDADGFMEELAQKLDCFPPVLLTDPFSHIETIISENIDFSTGGPYAEQLRIRLMDLIREAEGASQSVAGTVAHIPDLSQLLLAGKYSEIFTLWKVYGDQFKESQKDDVAWAYVIAADEEVDEAQEIASTDIAQAHQLWFQAGEKYEQALNIKPDMHEALSNFGRALLIEADAIANRDVVQARKLWSLAGNKLEQALKIKPDIHQALNNWGIVLNDEANAIARSDLVHARKLWSLAGEKYEQAINIKSDYHEALNNWARALHCEAGLVADIDLMQARELWAKCREKYEQALKIKPDLPDVLNNAGFTLYFEAKVIASSNLVQARQFWSQARVKYEQALNIKPDMILALCNWGNALNSEAHAISDSNLVQARQLWSQAGEKYEQALSIKLDEYKTLNDWGNALSTEAMAIASSNLKQARKLWFQAGEKYEQTLKIKPDQYKVLNYWSNILLTEYQYSHVSFPDESLRLLSKVAELMERGIEHAPKDLSYNYACYWSYKNAPEQSVHWLKVSEKYQVLPNKQHIDEDVDLNNIRESKVFIDWYENKFRSSSSS